MKKRILVVLAVLMMAGVARASVPDPEIYLPFENEDGTILNANPALANWGLASPDRPTAHHTDANLMPKFTTAGIRGKCADYSSAPMGGTFGTYRYGSWLNDASNTPMELALMDISYMTITGWFKTNPGVIIGNNARILSVGEPAVWGLLSPPDGGRLSIYHSATGIQQQSTRSYLETGKWVFFAMTWDGSQQLMRWYKGNSNSNSSDPNSLVLLKEFTTAGMSHLAGDSHGCIVYLASNQVAPGLRSFQGLLDELRIFVSASDSSKALSKEQIEEIRQQDLSFMQPADCSYVKAMGLIRTGDLNQDCYIDLQDMAVMAQNWLGNFTSLLPFAQQWLLCNEPSDPVCTPNW